MAAKHLKSWNGGVPNGPTFHLEFGTPVAAPRGRAQRPRRARQHGAPLGPDTDLIAQLEGLRPGAPAEARVTSSSTESQSVSCRP